MAKELFAQLSTDPIPLLPQDRALFAGVIDEFNEEKEVEAKLGMQKNVLPIPLLTGLISHFESSRSLLTPVVHEVFSTTSNIDKYSDPEQNFSVVTREDGVSFVKVKSNKCIEDGVIIVDEQKRLLPQGKNLFDAGVLAPDIDPETIEYFGTLERNKARVLVADSFRMYQVVCDTTRVIDPDGNDLFPELDPLQQVEIEYKGTYSLLTSGVPRARLVGEIATSVREIRDDVQSYFSHSSIPTEVTTETKTKWLKGLINEHASR